MGSGWPSAAGDHRRRRGRGRSSVAVGRRRGTAAHPRARGRGRPTVSDHPRDSAGACRPAQSHLALRRCRRPGMRRSPRCAMPAWTSQRSPTMRSVAPRWKAPARAAHRGSDWTGPAGGAPGSSPRPTTDPASSPRSVASSGRIHRWGTSTHGSPTTSPMSRPTGGSASCTHGYPRSASAMALPAPGWPASTILPGRPADSAASAIGRSH